MKKILLLAAASFALFASAVYADELTAAKRAQIKTLLDITGIKAIPEQIANNTVQSWVPGIKQLDPKFPDKGFATIRDAFLSGLNAKVDGGGGLIEQVTIVYHNQFTGPEIADLLKFYQSPLGKKLLGSQAKVNGETFQAAMKWADSMSAELDQRIDAALKKEGLKLPEAPKPAPAQAGAPAAPAAPAAQPPAKK
jgi:uncharacterized protein